MKEALRKEYLAKRRALSRKEVAGKSRKIISKLLADPLYKAAQTIMIYLSKENEVDTHALLHESGKRIVLPKVKGSDLICCLYSRGNLAIGSFGVLEPNTEEVVASSDIGLILVPGVVFDKKGNRIGYGMGYYDRLLSHMKCQKIGLAYDFQIAEKIDATLKDVKMDKVITDEGHWP